MKFKEMMIFILVMTIVVISVSLFVNEMLGIFIACIMTCMGYDLYVDPRNKKHDDDDNNNLPKLPRL